VNAFIFQSAPSQYDLRFWLHAGATEPWHATRYRNEMKPGDVVFFWMGGNESFSGLYGWGELASAPYAKSDSESHGVNVRVKTKFAQPILAHQFRALPALNRLLLFRAPQATNVLLGPDQARAVVRLIRERGEEAPML
jgi:EVE domain